MVKKPLRGQERLTLNKETLRQLEKPELIRIAGGTSAALSCITACNATYFGCCKPY